MVVFQLTHWNWRFKHGSVNAQCLCYFHIVFECTPDIHEQRKMLVLPNQLLDWVPSTSDQCFVSFQPILCHPHTQIRINLFDGVRRDIPNLELSPNHDSIEFSQIAFPIAVLPKDDRTDSFHEERLDLPYWNMIWASCVVVNESKCLDIPIWEYSVILEHLPFLLGYKQILRLLLVHRNLAIWRCYPWLLLLSFEMLMILVRWILRKTLNRLLQYHLGAQLDLCISDTEVPAPNSWDDRDPSMTSKFVCVVLETSMYFTGIGNDSSLGE